MNTSNEYLKEYRKFREARGWKMVSYFLPPQGAELCLEWCHQYKKQNHHLWDIPEWKEELKKGE